MTTEKIDIIQGLASRYCKTGISIVANPDTKDSSCVIITADSQFGSSKYRTHNYGRARYAIMYLYYQHIQMLYADAGSELFNESLRLAREEGVTKAEMENIDNNLVLSYD